MEHVAEQAKDVICQIIAAAGGELKGKIVLYKAFYFAHLYHWKECDVTLTDYPIVRMPQGPGIANGNLLLPELQSEGRICIDFEPEGPYREYSFSLARPYSIDRSDPRCRAIEQAVAFVKDNSATELSRITDDNSRSWRQATDGEELNIYIDLMEDEEYLEMQRRLSATADMVNRVFA